MRVAAPFAHVASRAATTSICELVKRSARAPMGVVHCRYRRFSAGDPPVSSGASQIWQSATFSPGSNSLWTGHRSLRPLMYCIVELNLDATSRWSKDSVANIAAISEHMRLTTGFFGTKPAVDPLFSLR